MKKEKRENIFNPHLYTLNSIAESYWVLSYIETIFASYYFSFQKEKIQGINMKEFLFISWHYMNIPLVTDKLISENRASWS